MPLDSVFMQAKVLAFGPIAEEMGGREHQWIFCPTHRYGLYWKNWVSTCGSVKDLWSVLTATKLPKTNRFVTVMRLHYFRLFQAVNSRLIDKAGVLGTLEGMT